MNIKGFQELTLKDWPGKVASIIFLGGCNLNCFYCHNSELALRPDTIEDIPEEFILNKLEEKKGWIDGVIISGGEPTIYGEKLKELIIKIREKGFKIKIFTNGTNPDLIEELIKHNLIDAISVDIKHAPAKYYLLMPGNSNDLEKKVWDTVKIVKGFEGEVFFRTTLIKGIHEKEDIKIIRKIIYPFELHLQNAQDNGVLEYYKSRVIPFSERELEEMKGYN
ncbi:MAG: anaerobic ribonucleoside-triphosphate reductase activating protein [Proteobacteria bacterium]|nr:anaerobic ribonucleoside-triphosphate reductase activating protein [Pseudomonadota bacterium]